MRHRWKVIFTFALLALCGPARAQWYFDFPFPKTLHPRPDTVTVSFIGDMMMHEKQLGYDCDGFLSELGSVTRDADISIANLEFSLAGKP